MSEMLEFEDLSLLDGGDLKAVLDQLEPPEAVAALWGATHALRSRLLRQLPRRASGEIERQIAATEHVTFEQVRNAQLKAIAEMCRLSRNGQIAFDAPEDLVA